MEVILYGCIPNQLPENVAGQADILWVVHVDVRGGDGGPLVVGDHLTFT